MSTQMGIATLGNVAESAFHQGIDLWGEHKERIVAGAEFHASLMSDDSSGAADAQGSSGEL